MQKWNAWHSFFLVLESDMEVVTHQFDPLWEDQMVAFECESFRYNSYPCFTDNYLKVIFHILKKKKKKEYRKWRIEMGT